MPKRRLVGTILSTNMQQTAVVTVVSHKVHPIYQKRYKWTEKYLAHNPNDQYQLGELVSIIEHRPISKSKRWTITERLQAAELTDQVKDVELDTEEESEKSSEAEGK